MFHNLKGYPNWTAVSYMCGSREKMALGLGTTKDKALTELGGRIAKGLIKPKIVEDGPVKEIIWKGDDADLGRIPIHVHSDSDRGVPFIGSAMQFVKDPETGTQNIALQRDHIKGPKKMGIFVHPKRHTDICMQKYWQQGKAMPVATVIGHHPAYYIASTWTTSYETDEIDITGALVARAGQHGALRDHRCDGAGGRRDRHRRRNPAQLHGRRRAVLRACRHDPWHAAAADHQRQMHHHAQERRSTTRSKAGGRSPSRSRWTASRWSWFYTRASKTSAASSM